MTMDFSGSAGAATDFDVLPKGLLVWAILTVRGVKGSGSGGKYIDCELTVDQGQPYQGRKFWEMVGDPFHPGNSEKYRQMGQIAITRILEAGRGAGPNNPNAYKLDDYSQLSGLRVPVKVGVEEGTDGHADKNRVAEWLTPNPQSQSGYKGFEKLSKGDHGIAANGGNGGGSTNGFGGQQTNGGGFGQAQTGSGFGGASASVNGQQTGNGSGGFGNSGFNQPPADGSGQSGANNGAATAGNQTQTGASASPSNGTAGNWLEQANGGQPTA